MSDDLLQLFSNPSALETATPGARAWLAADLLPSSGTSTTSRPILVKRLPRTDAREERLLAALELVHPNIVRTRRVLGHDTDLFVVRDIVRGRNLRQSLLTATGARPSPELLRLMVLPLLDALHYAHERDIAHGGVSAENVLISDEGRVQLADWGTADPTASRHTPFYHGQATPAGDIKALAHLISAYLPVTGPFASLDVRGRIESILGQADTVADLREVVGALERLAGSGAGNAANAEPARRMPTLEMPPATPHDAPPLTPFPVTPTPPAQMAPTATVGAEAAAPPLLVEVGERTLRLTQGGGELVTLNLRCVGPLPITLRMIATQHTWLNVGVGNWSLPLEIAPGQSRDLPFTASAARLSPGEYRSEVYLVYSDGTPGSDAPQTWLKHTTEVRVQVSAPPSAGPRGSGSLPAGGKPPFPPDAPRVPLAPGCAGTVLTLLVLGGALCSGIFVFL